MKKTNLKKIYRFNEDEKVFTIEVSLDYYQELFNDWDASPMRKRDLNPELVEYLEAASYDIPRSNKLEISFSIPVAEKNIPREKKSIDGIKNNFMTALYFIKKELNLILRKIAFFIILGFIFILTAYLTQNQTSIAVGFNVLFEGVYIGGWVLLWEAFSLFFFSMYELRKRKAMYTRFFNSNIVFSYRGQN